MAASTVTVQRLSVTESKPPKPVKVEPGPRVAVRVTVVFSGKSSSQSAPQSMPAGSLVTEPVPLRTTERMELGPGTNT